MKLDKKLSFVIPCYYSELSIGHVVEGIFQAFPTGEYDYEIILVNDGSTDNTYQVIKELAATHTQIIAANLSRNFGQDAALMAGYSLCSGDYVISLDDDGQNPPMEAHKLLEKIQEGYDAVFGKYHVKKHSRFKNWGSRLNDRMATCLLNKPKDLTLCSYFVMTRFVIDQILKYDSGFPYIWGLILRSTDKLANVFIDHKEREFGTTTFTLGKLVMLWLNGFTSFSIKPLRLASILGGILACIGFIGTLYIVISQFFYPEPIAGWASLMSVLLVMGGLLMMMMGLLGEYIGRIFLSINKAPLFIIRDLYKNENTMSD